MYLMKRTPLLLHSQINVTPAVRLIHQPTVNNSSSSATVAATVTVTTNDDEYTDKPIYPEIIDNSYDSRKIRKYEEWHNKIKNLKTIEEKLIKINMPRYYGYKSVMLNDEKYPYNCLPLTQHYTRTELIENNSLLNTNTEQIHSLTEQIKSSIIDTIEFSTDFFRRKYKHNTELTPHELDKIYGGLIAEQINNILLNVLSNDFEHLSNIVIDVEPRHEAFWWVGGIKPPKNLQKSRKGVKWLEKYANEPIDRAVQYLGIPYLAIRHKLPLKQLIDNETLDITNPDKPSNDIPIYEYDARTIGYSTDHRHGTNIPGYWPGSIQEFGLLSYQKRNHMLLRPNSYDKKENQEALHAQGIQSSFAWLFAQACYQGFSSFQDITYPLCTQTIITNGQKWSFYQYQLNTTLIHSKNPMNNPKKNQCWATSEVKLFEEINENCKCIGFNDQVLKHLIEFYINVPMERNINLKPYLGETEQKIADIKHHDRRVFLEKIFKNMSSNRPRHRLVPETYMWEKFYKIDNNTRPLEAKRRFFELGINPFKRRMDQHARIYVPKVKQNEGPKRETKWDKMYYP